VKHTSRSLRSCLAVAAVATGLGLFGSHAARAAQMPVRADTGQALAATVAQSSGETLSVGCNVVTLTNLTVGMKVGDWVAQNVQPVSAVISVWHFDNASQHYMAAYFSDPAVPVDQPTFTAPIDGFFICVSSSATAP
jgi:hypothetical protein